MRKRFLGIICFLYAIIIIYLFIFNKLKNYLAPNMQKYILLSVIPLLFMGLVMFFNNKIHYSFKVKDSILLLPVLMLILSGDGRLTMSFASQRTQLSRNSSSNNSVSQELDSSIDKEVISNQDGESINDDIEYDFSNVDFNVIDESYDGLAGYLTYVPSASFYEGKTIRVRGFTMTDYVDLPDGYFAIGKYSITCCIADASFTGFIAKYANEVIKNNTWYEIEGILEKGYDKQGNSIMTIRVINLKEIDGSLEEQYVYPCYAYDNGTCAEMQKYNLIQ